MALKKCPLPSPTVETISRKLCQRGQKKGDKVVKPRSSKVRTSIKVQWSRKTESDFAEVLPLSRKWYKSIFAKIHSKIGATRNTIDNT